MKMQNFQILKQILLAEFRNMYISVSVIYQEMFWDFGMLSVE